MMTDYEPRVNEEELADSIRRAWRLMQYHRHELRRKVLPPSFERLYRSRAQACEATLRSLLAVRKAGRVR